MKRPTTPEELRDQLFSIFPDFRKEWEVADNEFIDRGAFNYHGLMFRFREYFRVPDASAKQIKALAEVFNQAVAVDDDLENAVSTVYLEHMHQMKVSKVFNPFLSAQAKRKSHA